MDNDSTRLRALIRGAFVFTTLAITVMIALVIAERHRGSPPPPVLFEVPDFALTNQEGRLVTRADLRGKVWLANIIFTRCAGPCPVMTWKLSGLQATLPAGQSVRLVTLTTDPAYDTPEVLRAYAQRFSADPARWYFLTGTKSQIAQLAVNGLRLTAVEKDFGARETPEDLFIHSTLLVLVDRHGRVRATFESDQPELNTRVLPVVNRLLREE